MGFNSWHGQEPLLFSGAFRLAPGHAQPSVHRLPGAGVKQLWHEVDPSPTSVAEVQDDIPLLFLCAVVTCTEITLPLCRWISVISVDIFCW